MVIGGDGVMSRLRRLIAITGLVSLLLTIPSLTPSLLAADSETTGAGSPTILSLTVDGMITAGTAGFLQEQINDANAQNNVVAILIRLNTPGGLLDPTLDIVSEISQSDVPIITYVSPSGAIAASAGSIILIASHVAAMAPGTTTGAAMPVSLDPASGGNPTPADEKTINFLAGHLRSIARERDRPADTIARFVTENLTLDANDALDSGVIDVIAQTADELLAKIDGNSVSVNGREISLKTAGAELVEVEMSLSHWLQDLVSNPQLAFLLLIGGAYALYFGLSAPGTLIPETLGAVLVLMGLYGLGLFDTNLTGILLLLLGISFLIAELFTPTNGALTVAGIVSLTLGAMVLPAEPLLGRQWFNTFRATVWGLAIGMGVLIFITSGAIIRSRRNLPKDTRVADLPRQGYVTTDLNPEGLVRVRGEIWRAKSKRGVTIPAGTQVKITGRDGLTLFVEPLAGNEQDKDTERG